MEQFTGPIELNYNPENKNEIFGVPMDRALQIADELDAITNEFVANKAQWTIKGTGKYEGKTRLDEGGMLKKVMAVAKTPNEWAFALYSANLLFENVKIRWELAYNAKIDGADLAAAIAEELKKAF